LFLLVLGITAAASAQAPCNPSTYQSSLSAANVMYYSRFLDPSIVTVSAHRGYWEYALEGSPAAIDAAVNVCADMVEMDLRLTSDNVPVPGHDWSLERLTNGTGYIYDTSFATYLSLDLKDRTGAVTSTPVPTLDTYLQKMNQYPNLVLVLDCKESKFATTGLLPSGSYPTSYQVLVSAWTDIQAFEQNSATTLSNRIIFKIRFNELPASPQTVLSDLDINLNGQQPTTTNTLLAIVPILYATDYNGTTMSNYQAVYDVYSTIAGGVNFNTGFVWFPETPVKFPNDTLQQLFDQDAKPNNENATAFSPSPDWPEGTSMGSGLCCRFRNTLNQILGQPVNGVYPQDYTGDPEYLAYQGFHWVSTDKVPDILNYLYAIDARNTAKLMQSNGTMRMP
jgi:hypothetical protein